MTTKSFTIGKRATWKARVGFNKMDVENNTLCVDLTVNARSLDSKKHWSREAITSIWRAKCRYSLPGAGELLWRT